MIDSMILNISIAYRMGYKNAPLLFISKLLTNKPLGKDYKPPSIYDLKLYFDFHHSTFLYSELFYYRKTSLTVLSNLLQTCRAVLAKSIFITVRYLSKRIKTI